MTETPRSLCKFSHKKILKDKVGWCVRRAQKVICAWSKESSQNLNWLPIEFNSIQQILTHCLDLWEHTDKKWGCGSQVRIGGKWDTNPLSWEFSGKDKGCGGDERNDYGKVWGQKIVMLAAWVRSLTLLSRAWAHCPLSVQQSLMMLTIMMLFRNLIWMTCPQHWPQQLP